MHLIINNNYTKRTLTHTQAGDMVRYHTVLSVLKTFANRIYCLPWKFDCVLFHFSRVQYFSFLAFLRSLFGFFLSVLDTFSILLFFLGHRFAFHFSFRFFWSTGFYLHISFWLWLMVALCSLKIILNDINITCGRAHCVYGLKWMWKCVMCMHAWCTIHFNMYVWIHQCKRMA